MISNFMCEDCKHSMVCEKLKHILKFDENAKKNLMIDITMDDCMNYETGAEATSENAAN